MQQPFRRLVLPSLVVFLLSAPLPAEILERVVAKVNGDIVTLTDFQARQLAAAQAARISPERVEAFLRQQNAKILQDAVDELLLTQRAADLGMRMRPEVVRDIIEGIKKENNLETDAQLQEQLRREGMSMDDLKRSIERSIQRRQVLQREIEPKIAVSEEDSYAEYQKKKAEFAKPATVTLEEILVEGDDAREKAEALVARARAGEDFAALARAYSKAPSAKNGGELGKLAQGEMNAELEKQAFALAKGAISDPLPQGAGYRILKISDKTEASVVPYEEAKKDIRARLGEERIEKEYQAYMATLRDKAVVQIQVREVPLQLSGPVPENALLDTPLLGGGGGSLGLGGEPKERPAPPPAEAPQGSTPPAAAAAPAAPAAPAADEAEFTTTGSAVPERVVPPAGPGAEEEKKEPEKPPLP
ncbi:MAG TPA: peptidylprolyl isomerase [Vicinamibacteria bacterium]